MASDEVREISHRALLEHSMFFRLAVSLHRASQYLVLLGLASLPQHTHTTRWQATAHATFAKLRANANATCSDVGLLARAGRRATNNSTGVHFQTLILSEFRLFRKLARLCVALVSEFALVNFPSSQLSLAEN